MFKLGDIVECIDDSSHQSSQRLGPLIKGAIYVIMDVSGSNVKVDQLDRYFSAVSITGRWHEDRFKLANFILQSEPVIEIDYLSITKDIIGDWYV